MSRSGYVDCCDLDDNLAEGRAIAQWNNTRRGKRGQAFFSEMIAALDAMPVKELHKEIFQAEPEGMPFALKPGPVCAMGAVAAARGKDMTDVDPYEIELVASELKIPETMARQVAWENDEGSYRRETPNQRWRRMRKWCERNIKGSLREYGPDLTRPDTW